MPYKRIDKIVYVKRGKKWVQKATAKSVEAAKKMIRLLHGKKHGK